MEYVVIAGVIGVAMLMGIGMFLLAKDHPFLALILSLLMLGSD